MLSLTKQKRTVPTQNQNKTRIKVARTSIKHTFFNSPTRAYYTLSISSPSSFHQHFVRNDDAVPGIRRNLHAYHRSNGVRRRSETRGSFISYIFIFHFTFTYALHFFVFIFLIYSPISRSSIKTVATLLFIVSFIIP